MLDGGKRTPILSVTPTQSHQTIAKTRQTPGESKTGPQKQAENTQTLLRGVIKVSEGFPPCTPKAPSHHVHNCGYILREVFSITGS